MPLRVPDEPPRVLELRSTACQSLTIRWAEPPDLSAAQIDYYALILSLGTRDGGPIATNLTMRHANAYTNPALLAGTTYGAEVRAVNPLGRSGWSERLIASTPAPTRAPQRPPAPIIATGDRSCDVSITLALPAAKAGVDDCDGPERLEVQTQHAGTTSWRTLSSRTTSNKLVVGAPADISPGKAHRFRVVSANRHGVSAPGVASAAVVGGLPEAVLMRPPAVLATSSASFAIALPISLAPCLESLQWTVRGRLGPHGWQVLGTGLQGSTVTVEQLRCPKIGCEIKLRPDVSAFAGTFEGPSVVVHNAQLPPLAPGDARVEVRLRGVEWNSLVRAEFRSDLQAQLSLHQEAELVESHVNAHAGDTSVVVDLKGPEAASAAQQLARIVADGIETGGGVLKRVERSVGVQQYVRGEWRSLLPPPLPKSTAWASLSTSLANLVILGICIRLTMAGIAAWRRRQQLKGAVPLAMSEEDADEEEEEMDVGGRTSSRRAVDARSSISYMQEDDDFPA